MYGEYDKTKRGLIFNVPENCDKVHTREERAKVVTGPNIQDGYSRADMCPTVQGEYGWEEPYWKSSVDD